MDFRTRVLKLISQISEIKDRGISENIFLGFLEQLKPEAASLIEHSNNEEIKLQLYELANFRTFDELPFYQRFLEKMALIRFRADWVGTWKEVGKYMNDLNGIELKLKGILYKLDN